MPPKKQNSFYYYMIEFKKLEEAKGIHFPNGLKDVAVAASASWKAMPPSKKKKYEEMVQGNKTNEKYNSIGISLTEISKQKREEAFLEDMENDEISQVIDEAINKNTLLELTFFIMQTNIYCQLPQEFYVTSEVSLVAFSLKDGCSTVMHNLIDVGCIPIGYAREALKFSEETGIPLPPLQGAEANFVKILSEVLCNVGEGDKSVPIYTMPDSTRQVQSFLNQLCDSAEKDPKIFRLYSLPKLLYKLRNTLCKEGPPLPITMAQSVLERDVYLYVKGLSCDLHEDTDVFYKCSLSQATRWSYNICDYCCALAGVKIEAGRHVPQQSDVAGFQSVSRKNPENTRPKIVHVTKPVLACKDTYQIPVEQSDNVMEEGAWPSISQLKINNTPSWGPPSVQPGPSHQTAVRPRGDAVVMNPGKPPRITPSEDNTDWPQLATAGRGAGRRKH